MTRFSRSSDALQSSAVRELMKAAANPDMISFSGGMPNPDLFPVRELDQIISGLPLRSKQDGFQYGPTPGYPPLLESLSAYLRSKGLPVEDNGLIVTAGSLQAIHLTAKAFIDPGDVIVTETPCFVGAITDFRYFQAALRGVPLDGHGPVLRDLERAIEERPKLLYLTPYFHNPAGIVYSAERKAAVMNLLKGRDIPLLEDDAYGELHFDEPAHATAPLACARADAHYRVLLQGAGTRPQARLDRGTRTNDAPPCNGEAGL